MKKKLLTLFAMLSLVLPFSLHAVPPGNIADWTLTFDDEFTGTTLNKSNWAMTLSPGWQSEASSSSWWDGTGKYVVVNNGLRLICNNVEEQSGYPYTCGMISGHNGFNQMYGYFEARMKLPVGGMGMWPAFWLISKSSNNSWVWPPEIDIMEAQGRYPTENFMSNHASSNYPGTGGNDNYNTYTYTGPDFTAAYHTFGVNWTSTAITWYIDDVQVAQDTSYPPLAGNGFPGMYMILNNSTADGTGWEPAPNSSTIFPNELDVAYVRVYAPVSNPEPAPTAYTVSASAGTGGTISPSGNVSVTSGTNQTFTIKANNGYSINSVLVDGSSVGAVSSYTFSKVTANQTIAASFTPVTPTAKTYTINAYRNMGGSISPSGLISVNSGASQTFTVAARSGFTIKAIIVDGVSMGPLSSYTFHNVKANHTIKASFN